MQRAKERQKEHGETAPGKSKNTGGKFSTSDKGKSRDRVAEQLGISGKQYDKIKTVRDKYRNLKPYLKN